jgi:tetratricopeptide (TPR) repeat protein
MKTSGKLLLFTLLIGIFSTFQSFGQKGVEDGSRFGHGKDSIRCLKNLSLYVEFYKQNNYEDAVKPWTIVYNECPKASKNIYLHGEKMITDAIENADDQAKKQNLLDSLMQLYDKRIKYFGQKGFVLGKKGIDFIKYSKNSLDNIKKGYDILEESIELRGNKSSMAVLVNFMNTTRTLYDNDAFEGSKVVDNYSKTLKIIESELEEDPDDNTAQRAKKVVDKIFENSGAASCKNLVNLYKPRFEENKQDVELIRKILDLLTESNCEDSDLYLNANIQLNKVEPNASAAHHIAQLYLERENIDKTIEYYKKAIEIQENDEKKADYYLELASLTFEELKDKPTARKYARNALDLNPKAGAAYILIGRLYTQSLEECGGDEFEKKAVLWAAVDKFIKAKQVDPDIADEAQGYINSYRPRFPDKKSIFFHNYEIGDSYRIGCWINETTTVRTSE